MTITIKWYAALSVVFGVLTLFYLPCVGLAVVFSCFTVAAVILNGQDEVQEQIGEIAQAHFDRQTHEETFK